MKHEVSSTVAVTEISAEFRGGYSEVDISEDVYRSPPQRRARPPPHLEGDGGPAGHRQVPGPSPRPPLLQAGGGGFGR